ncbi:MAG TPA: ABC transporter permease [bacterium]|nr:ABC transporter permease [bacterium]
MTAYVFRRVLALGPLLLAVSALVFVALQFAPGDPAVLMLGQDATPQGVATLRHQLGLDRPLAAQYTGFVLRALRGDLGRSFQTHRPVAGELARTFGVTFVLATLSLAAATLTGMTVGCLSALRRQSWLDYLARAIVLGGVSIPIFWLGLLLISWFAIKYPLFPVSGWGTPGQVVLPVITLAAFPLAAIARMTRSSVLDVLGSDYVRTAYAKGLGALRIVAFHLLKNALIPVTTVVGLQFGTVLAGAVLTESVFALPGLGTLLLTAVLGRDYAIIRGAILLVAAVFAIINLAVDLAYAYLDPRIHYA